MAWLNPAAIALGESHNAVVKFCIPCIGYRKCIWGTLEYIYITYKFIGSDHSGFNPAICIEHQDFPV